MSASFYENETLAAEERDVSLRQAVGMLFPLLRKRTRRLALCLALLIATTLLALAWPYLLQRAIDGPMQQPLDGGGMAPDFTPILWIGCLVLVIQALTIVLQYIQRVLLETIGQETMLELKTGLFNHILSLDIAFFDRHPVGRLMSRIESDTESLRLLFTNTVVVVIGDVLMMIGIWSVMFWKNWRVAAILFTLLPVLALLIWIFHRLTTHRFLEVRKRMAEVTASLTEFLHGMSIVQIFHRGDYARARVYRANERKFSEDAYVNVAVCVFFNVLFFIEHVKMALILSLGVLWHLTPGMMVMFILLVWMEFEPIARTADQLGSFQKGLAGARRIFALRALTPKIAEPLRPRTWPRLTRSIRFEHVWFSYTDDEDWVLRDVSFEIPVGGRTALVGVTGGGKSTIISLLLRLYDPQRGRILVDGIDIRQIPTAELRSRFALVLQDILLFPGDVASNIALEDEALPLNAVQAAAETVAADPFIRALPRGYQTVVSEKGANFSRGERQLLSFARALVTNPDLLILDEATSSVDPETERTIQRSLHAMMVGRTSLVIAHRLATIRDVEQILVLRGGEIVERGSHEDLLQAAGTYARLCRLQFATYDEALNHAT